MSVYRSMFRQTAVYTASMFLVRFSGILLLRVYTSYLSPSDYGVMELLDLTSTVLIMLIGLRLGDALTYHYFNSHDEDTRNVVVSTALIGSIIVSGVMGLTTWLLAEPISWLVFGTVNNAQYFRIIFCTLGVSLPMEVGVAYLRTLNRPKAVAKVQICRALLSISVSLTLLIWFHFRIAAMLCGTFMSALAGAVVLSIYIFRTRGWKFDRTLFLRQYKYAIPVSMGGVGILFIHYGDRFFLQRYGTLTELGIYALSYKLGMLVSYLYEPFGMYWNSQVYLLLRRTDGEKIYVRTLTYVVLGLLSAALCLSMFSHPVISILTTTPFHGAARLVPLIAMAYVLRGSGDHARRILMVENRTGLELRVSIVAAAVCLGGYGILIPLYKSTGAAVATLVAFLTVSLYGFWQAQQIRRFHFELRRLGILFGSAALTLIVHTLIMPKGFWPQMGTAVACMLGFIGLLLVTRFPEKDEIEALRSRLADVTGRFTAANAN